MSWWDLVVVHFSNRVEEKLSQLENKNQMKSIGFFFLSQHLKGRRATDLFQRLTQTFDVLLERRGDEKRETRPLTISLDGQQPPAAAALYGKVKCWAGQQREAGLFEGGGKTFRLLYFSCFFFLPTTKKRQSRAEQRTFFTLSIAPASLVEIPLPPPPPLWCIFPIRTFLMTFGPLISIFSITLRSSPFSHVHAKK